MASLQLDIVTPDKLVLSQEVEYVGVPGLEGDFGVLPNHVRFLSALQVGNLFYKLGGKNHYIFVSGGFAEVADNKMTVLAESAEKAEDIDVERARRAKERAEARLAQQKDQVDAVRAQCALERAVYRIKAREYTGLS